MYLQAILPICTEFQNFHRRLRSWNDLRRNQSVFHQRTEDSSALEYFQVEICVTLEFIYFPFLWSIQVLYLRKKLTYFRFPLQFHSCLSQQQNKLQDYHRIATYQKAILLNDVDFKDKVCVSLSVQLWIDYSMLLVMTTIFNLVLNTENYLCSPVKKSTPRMISSHDLFIQLH